MAKTLRGPTNKWPGVPELQMLSWSDNDHTPYNKCAGEVESSLDFSISRHTAGKLVEFHIMETTTSRNGVTQSRSISFDIPKEHADKLANFMRTGSVEEPSSP